MKEKIVNRKLLSKKRLRWLGGGLGILTVVLFLSLAIIPKIMAGNTVVNDLTIQASASEKIINVVVSDQNESDTKVILPLPEGVTYQTNGQQIVGVTEDNVNHQLVIDWVEGQAKQVNLQFEAKQDGKYDFVVNTVRDNQPVSSTVSTVEINTIPSSSSSTTEPSSSSTTEPSSSGTDENVDIEDKTSDTNSVEQALFIGDTNFDFSYILSPENDEGTEFSIKNITLSENSEGFGSISITFPKGMSNNVNDITLPDGWGLTNNSSGFSIIIEPGASATEVKNFLSTLKLTTNTEYKAPDTISITIEQNKISHWVDPSGKNHYYQFVSYKEGENASFQKSYNLAKKTTYKGLTGYLATITSDEEQNFIYKSIAKEPGWLGGATLVFSNGNRINDEQSISEKTNTQNPNVDYKQGDKWYWIDGPEAGTVFYNTKKYDPIAGPVPGVYSKFNPGEPNNDKGKESVLIFAFANNDMWDDLADYYIAPLPNSMKGYYIEYSEYGDQKEEQATNTFNASIPQAVTVKYIDTHNNKIIADFHSSGAMGISYETEQKDIPGYKFKKVDGPTTGKFTDQPQTITYTYTSDVLRFYDVPSKLSFNETKISSKTETISRKEPNWKIIVEDTRLSRRNWRVTAKLSEQFKDSTGTPLDDNILLFRKTGQEDQWISSDSETDVFDGTSTEDNELYDASWSEQEGPLIQVAPGTVKIGEYTGIVNWSLIDAPA
jgi:hypothetical protein